MLSLSKFAIPRKVKLSVQIPLFTWNVLVIFNIYWCICGFANGKCSFNNCPLDFLHFQVFITILNIHLFLPNLFIAFFMNKSEHFCGFLHVFIFVLNFSKALGFCQTLFAISARSLLIFPLFLHLCQVLILSLSVQSQNLYPLIPCWFLKYYLGYHSVHCHHQHEDWPVIIFMLWFIITWSFVTFFTLVSLSSRGINPNFLFFFSLPYLLLKFTFWTWWRFRACFPIVRLSIFPQPLPFSLGSRGTFFYYFVSQVLELEQKCIHKKLKAII